MSDESTYQVQFWKLRRSEGRRRPWGVRWVTAGKEHSESYATKALAESFRSELVRAARAGEAFDVASGLPPSMTRKRQAGTFHELAVAYVDHVWKSAPPNTRRGVMVNLAAIVPKFVADLDHRPAEDDLQRLLSTRLLPPPRRDEPTDAEDRAIVSWLRRASRPVEDLNDSLAARALLQSLSTARTAARSPRARGTSVARCCTGWPATRSRSASSPATRSLGAGSAPPARPRASTPGWSSTRPRRASSSPR